MEPTQAAFSGWAIVECMGRQVEIGFVTTEAYGQAVMFRVDTPDLPEREFVLTAPEYANVDGSVDDDLRQWCPAGSKVKRAASPARTRLLSPGALYAINPCNEEAARQALERKSPRPLILIERAPGPSFALSSPTADDLDPECICSESCDETCTGECGCRACAMAETSEAEDFMSEQG